MITRLLVALFALYIVAGQPKLDASGLTNFLPGAVQSESGQAQLARQAVDFCLAHRETCAKLASGLISSPNRTGTIAEPPPITPHEQALPLLAPDLPLPPRRSKSPRHGA